MQEPQTFSDLLYEVVTGQRNNEESRRKALSVKDGQVRLARKGHRPGGPRAYGTEWTAWLDDRGRRINEQRWRQSEVPVVQRIFSESVAGRSQMAIAKGLNEDGVPTATGKAWFQSGVRRGSPTPSTPE